MMKVTGRMLRSLSLTALAFLLGVSISAHQVHAAGNGDVNGNGYVDVVDALHTLRYIANLIPHDPDTDATFLATADVYPLDENQSPEGDNRVDISDAILILGRTVNSYNWSITPPVQPGEPVQVALDSTGTVQSTVTAESLGGFQLTLNAGTRIALVSADGDSQPPAAGGDVKLSVVDESSSLPTLPAGITPLVRFRIVMTVNDLERKALFSSASEGIKLVIPIDDQSVSDGTLGLLFSLDSGSPVKVGSSAISSGGGASWSPATLAGTASVVPLASGDSGSSQMQFNPGGTGSYAAGGSPPGSGSPPQGAFWSEFTVPDPGPVDLGGGVVVDDPSRVESVIIVEDSTKEILGDCFFGGSNSAATGPSGSDGGQFWCTRSGNTITISSPQANLPKIHARRVSTLNTNLVMWNISNIYANGGLHGPGGAVYADPYTHKEFQFAGFKKLMFISKTYTIAKKHAREPLENAGYSDLQSQFVSPVTEIDVTTLDGRQKLQDDVILKQHWKLVAGETRGNLGTYEWKDKYKGTAKAIATMPIVNYKVWEIDASDVTFEIDPTYTNMDSDTVVYRTTGGKITQTQYTVPGNAGGCYGVPASFTDTYDVYPGDGYLSIFPGTDTIEYNASASISLSTPVQDHPYKQCCSWRTPACEDMVLEAGGQQHEWLRTGGMNSRRTANPDETLQGSYATPPYSTPSYEWNLAPEYDNQ